MSLFLYGSLLLAAPIAEEPPATDGLSDPEGIFVAPVERRFAQVRIEKRVIIRVPRRRNVFSSALADINRRSEPPTYTQKKIGKCLPMNNILGVQRFGKRYVDLVTKDRKQIRARLEKKCQARSFYSGFYMEKSSDGKICADRDILHSRTGSKCEIDRFRLLVPE
ncbi:hypothetical protein [Parasphingorhabdus cellanae]|uniref:Uncharacterized protein n=1 Tax=Parasphingorhabdus cellanae TaxID=2806553 RepID=A0ABX7T9D5_9SPHN|nr:hypothetical protein [Parasphingorhabdus cellanae]QTD57590.1 hypothetical protein J4G78_08760 [Parasphingorhabdus cellanae]